MPELERSTVYTFILSYIVYFVIYYFVLFRYKCQCSNGARCHQTSGKCSCTPGWRGIFCDTPCPAGRWGAECKEECTCKNGGSCHHITGAYCEFYILKERLDRWLRRAGALNLKLTVIKQNAEILSLFRCFQTTGIDSKCQPLYTRARKFTITDNVLSPNMYNNHKQLSLWQSHWYELREDVII